MKLPKIELPKELMAKLDEHSPEILIGIGIAGFVGAMILSAKAGVKVHKKVKKLKEEHKTEKLADIPKKELVKEVGPDFIAPAVAAGASAYALIRSNAIASKRFAALTAAYELREAFIKEYKQKVKEEIGEQREREVNGQALQAHAENNPANSSPSAYAVLTGGKRWYLEPMTGKRFISDDITIGKGVNYCNARLRDEIYIQANDLWYEWGMFEGTKNDPEPDAGRAMGFNYRDGDIDVCLDPENQIVQTDPLTGYSYPVQIIEYLVEPRDTYRNSYA